MKLPKRLSKAGSYTYNVCKKNSPEILTGLGIAGFIAATIIGIFETPKYLDDVEKKKEELEVEKLPIKDNAILIARHYVPTVSLIVASSSCVIKSNRIYAGRLSAAVTAYSLTETAYREYKDKVKETLGEKKEHEIEEKVFADRVKSNLPTDAQLDMLGPGLSLVYEPYTNQYAVMKSYEVDKAITRLNADFILENRLSLNDYIYELMSWDRSGEMHMNPDWTYQGWNMSSKDDLLARGDWGFKLNEDTGRTAIVINLNRDPTHDY